jgi:hypothetical protein
MELTDIHAGHGAEFQMGSKKEKLEFRIKLMFKYMQSNDTLSYEYI